MENSKDELKQHDEALLLNCVLELHKMQQLFSTSMFQASIEFIYSSTVLKKYYTI